MNPFEQKSMTKMPANSVSAYKKIKTNRSPDKPSNIPFAPTDTPGSPLKTTPNRSPINK